MTGVPNPKYYSRKEAPEIESPGEIKPGMVIRVFNESLDEDYTILLHYWESKITNFKDSKIKWLFGGIILNGTYREDDYQDCLMEDLEFDYSNGHRAYYY